MATDGGGASGYPDRPHSFSPLTWHFRMPAQVISLSLSEILTEHYRRAHPEALGISSR
jgi:hypothetical protein